MMICYRDMTFCAQDTCAKRLQCERYATIAHKDYAEKCGLPMSMALFTICYEDEKNAKTENAVLDKGNQKSVKDAKID